jgi:hypothetical protein
MDGDLIASTRPNSITIRLKSTPRTCVVLQLNNLKYTILRILPKYSVFHLKTSTGAFELFSE